MNVNISTGMFVKSKVTGKIYLVISNENGLIKFIDSNNNIISKHIKKPLKHIVAISFKTFNEVVEVLQLSYDGSIKDELCIHDKFINQQQFLQQMINKNCEIETTYRTFEDYLNDKYNIKETK